MAGDKYNLTVGAEHDGLRLDQYLAAAIEDLSRRKARVVIDIGGVFVDKKRVKVSGRKVRRGQRVVVTLGGALARASGSVGGHARARDEQKLPDHVVLFDDDDLIVVDKPSGLLSAPTPESDRNNLLDRLQRGGGGREVFLVHRIDLETSGLLVFAKTSDANKSLAELFRTHDIERRYTAVVAGSWPEGAVDLRGDIDGRRARTTMTVRERLAEATVLDVALDTGRTHQIRIHCQRQGHPVLGDRRYGPGEEPRPPRLALHARTLGFSHPRTGEAVSYESPLPADLSTWLDGLRGTVAE